MRVKRRLVLVCLLVSSAGVLGLGLLGLNYGSEAQQSEAAQEQASPIPGAPGFDRDAQTAAERDGGPGGLMVLLVWSGATLSGAVFLASFLLFRVEVGREKRQLREERTRQLYHKQLRQYNAQLRGPPRHNT